jgi:hypothetical protein
MDADCNFDIFKIVKITSEPSNCEKEIFYFQALLSSEC